MISRTEPEVGGPRHPNFELIVAPEFLGFDRIAVTGLGEQVASGYRPPAEVAVFFPEDPPDQPSYTDVPADTRAFTLRPIDSEHGVDVALGIERAAHVKYLHIDGQDSGSTFLRGASLYNLMADLCVALPIEAAEGNYLRKAFDLDMGGDYGWENLGHLEELGKQGVINGMDRYLMKEHRKTIMDMNLLYADDPERFAFVERFNQRYRESDIFLRMIRPPSDVIIPHVVGHPHLTSSAMVALSSPRGEGGRRSFKKIHTFTPGRAMGGHPIPGEHYDPSLGQRSHNDERGHRGRVNMKTFRSSSWAWTEHALIVPERYAYEGRHKKAPLV